MTHNKTIFLFGILCVLLATFINIDRPKAVVLTDEQQEVMDKIADEILQRAGAASGTSLYDINFDHNNDGVITAQDHDLFVGMSALHVADLYDVITKTITAISDRRNSKEGDENYLYSLDLDEDGEIKSADMWMLVGVILPLYYETNHLDITVEYSGDANDVLFGNKNVLLMKFRIQTYYEDIELNQMTFTAEKGDLFSLDRYTLWADSDGDEVADEFIAEGIVLADRVIFNIPEEFNPIEYETSILAEIRGDVSEFPESDELQLAFATSVDRFITARSASEEREEIGIRVNGDCDRDFCNIILDDTDSVTLKIEKYTEDEREAEEAQAPTSPFISVTDSVSQSPGIEEEEVFSTTVTYRGSCPNDILTCPDGTRVVRDPKKNCKFPSCPLLRDVQIICEDSDDGIEPETAGSITVSGTRTRQDGEHKDFCTGNDLIEFYCERKDRFNFSFQICPYGCEEGACLPEVYEEEEEGIAEEEPKVSMPTEREIHVESTFSDIQDDNLALATEILSEKRIMTGFPDGTFKALRPVTRAEAVMFIVRAVLGKEPSKHANNGRFGDVKEGLWYVKYLVEGVNLGIIQGENGTLFRPGDIITTAEFLALLAKAYGLEQDLPHSFEDVSEDDWFAQYAGAVTMYGLFPEKEQNLEPNNSLNRGDVAQALHQLVTELE